MYKFNYKGEGFVKIDFFLLFKITNYLLSFILYNPLREIVFKLINLFIL